MRLITTAFKGEHLMARAARSASWLLLGYGGSQALRLVGNLILARLLFPEAFGILAVVNGIIVGLTLLSDTGVSAAISQSERGDDPDFLDTAYSIQIVRGILLWLFSMALAWPAGLFYGESALLLYLPIAGFTLVLNGFLPTRIETAYRHLLSGRVTVLDLISSVIGLLGMILLTLALQSTLALVLGMLVPAIAKLLLTYWFLPGRRNSFRWQADAVRSQMQFGKWIFLSTAFFFLTLQGDRLILGRFVSMDVLGLYNIGYFLANFPVMMGYAVNSRMLLPVYREKPASESRENWKNQRVLRTALSIGLVSMLLGVALLGPWLVDTLYDDRYRLSGPMVTLIAVSLIPSALIFTYDQAALAAGDSRTYFFYTASRAIAQTLLFVLGLQWFGLVGGIAAFGLSTMVAYPVLIWLSVKHAVWDPLHDGIGFVISAILSVVILNTHRVAIAELFTSLP